MLASNPEKEASVTPPFLVARDVRKTYGGVQALRGVSLTLRAGEIHGLVGANGAGKSTLIKVLAGLTHADAGEVLIDGNPVAVASPAVATDLGMNFIHQELAFIPGMTVLENIMLGLPKKTRFGIVDWTAIARDVEPVARRVGIVAPLNAKVKDLSTAENWLINICRALMRKARLIVMDEPTASLSAAESEKLFKIIEDLRDTGVSILYVSHRLDEILRLCAAVTVFRDGNFVTVIDRPNLTRAALVEAIVGGVVENLSHEKHHVRKEAMLSVSGLSRLPKVKDVSFELHRGEVLGIGGLVGAGRTELIRLIYGADRADAGQMTLDGQAFLPKTPAQAVKAGLGLVPEERRADGLLLTKSVAFNLQLSNLTNIIRNPALPLIDYRRRADLSSQTARDLSIKAQSIETPVGLLSGGNQQKVVIGRWLLRLPKILILDEPTRGVDIGARADIHRLIRELAARGMAVIVVSSEPDELPDLCDRVLVMAEGRIVRELTGAGITRNALVEASYAFDGTERN
ncbi:ABC-type sugar transport system ATPase subunit [Rhizobium sp. BK512]|jgi:ribose transport system ATP-binding protein/rhamnose transport system ATP-binding protein|uniref:sugar ABC transporter ATP-binding protein n=1 Tax=Rhizobium sp. BK512 TaxID=2587010 RepID=UPI000424C6E4|nr:sugar ABC transporter ATP-binding protein [Rhizobium sp. BK512]MBB3565567.1 ABC-type sugar transport system ATPase subunit [Rhizobium sp. BK512]